MIILLFTPALVPLAGDEKKPAKVLKHMEVDLGGRVKMKFAYIEAGKFMMGSPNNEKPRHQAEWQHEVEITKGYWMGVYEVTQEEYEKVLDKNPSHFKGARLPVERVSWYWAMEFCKKLSKKEGKRFDLPTEAEWEYACRAGTKTAYHYGDTLSPKQANFNFPVAWNSRVDKNAPRPLGKTAPVGSYGPNAFGLHDMHGNVSEWCKDWFRVEYYKSSPPRDPQGPTIPGNEPGHVLRGGNFARLDRECRSASRWFLRENWGDWSGFRVVLREP
jgi:formylglycine-generating enzyme required for sulfatase activity